MEEELILIKLIQTLKDKDFKHYTLEKEWWNNSENLQYAVSKKIYFPLIYSREFARFFWGTEIVNDTLEEAWSFHLQKTVISDNPLEYISTFLG